MEIYLLRHAAADAAPPGAPDSARELTDAGREKLRAVLERAAAAGVEPALILTSPYRRARQTAEEAAEVLHCRHIVDTPALVPDSTSEDVWAVICEHRREGSILLAGHEPLLSLTLGFLLGVPELQVDFKKSCLARVDLETFRGHPRGVLKWMLIPRLV